jgi:hypothetical protein
MSDPKYKFEVTTFEFPFPDDPIVIEADELKMTGCGFLGFFTDEKMTFCIRDNSVFSVKRIEDD